MERRLPAGEHAHEGVVVLKPGEHCGKHGRVEKIQYGFCVVKLSGGEVTHFRKRELQWKGESHGVNSSRNDPADNVRTDEPKLRTCARCEWLAVNTLRRRLQV